MCCGQSRCSFSERLRLAPEHLQVREIVRQANPVGCEEPGQERHQLLFGDMPASLADLVGLFTACRGDPNRPQWTQSGVLLA